MFPRHRRRSRVRPQALRSTGLRLRRAWEIPRYCVEYGQRLRLTIDTSVPDAQSAFQNAIAPWRERGRTPLSIRIQTDTARGVVDTDNALLLRTEPELIDALRALPGVSSVSLKLSPPPPPAPRE